MAMRDDRVVDMVTGYVDGFERVCANTGMSAGEVEEILAACDIHECPGCGWWVESFELLPVDSDDPDGHCDNCRP